MCSFQIGWLTLKEEFDRMLGSGQTDKDRDNVFNELKSAVRDESMKKHRWDEKAEDSLVHVYFVAFIRNERDQLICLHFIIHRL